MLTLSALRKAYRTETVETTALDSIDLHIDAGEFVAIMGPSGCGKSTLLNIIGLLDRPSAGSYALEGREVSRLTEAELTDIRKRRIGFIFQNFNLIDELTVRENVELALLYHGISAGERRDRVDRVLDKVGIGHRASHRPSQLSGGQQQRVAVARAVVAEPALILADEPTGNLDSKAADSVLDLMREVNRENGTSVLMVTHNLELAQRCDRILDLVDGRLVR